MSIYLRKLVIYLVLFTLPIAVLSKEYLLDGIWEIDHALQKGVHFDLSEQDRQLFKCQNLKIYFVDGVMLVWQSKLKCEGLNDRLPVFGHFYNYSTVYHGKETVLIESHEIKAGGKKTLDLINFINDDLFWVYPISKGQDLHVRYYYKRIKSEDALAKAKREIEGL